MARSTTLKRKANEKRWLEALYDKWPVQEEQANVNYLKLADEIGATSAPFLKATNVFKEIGVLITRLTYERGRRSFWTLAVPRDEAMRRLEAYHATENTKKMTTPEPQDVLVSSTGDDAGESPFAPLAKLKGKDEEEALVHAARQYAGRKQIVSETAKQLEAAGITLNVGAIEFTKDPVLEAVCLVLPAIDRRNNQIEYLTQRAEQMGGQVTPLHKRIRELEDENRGLRRIVDRMTEGKATVVTAT